MRPFPDPFLAVPRGPRDLGVVSALVLAYFLSAKLGLQLAIVHPSATPVWPPTGISLAALLVLGGRFWPGVLIGAFAANATTPVPLPVALGIAIGNTLEAALGAGLVQRYAGGARPFARPQDVFRFAALAGMLSTMVSATVGVTSLCLGGAAAWADFGGIWLTWWLGDAGGDLVVAPALLLWSSEPLPRWTGRKAAEAAAAAAALLAAGYIAFWSPGIISGIDLPLKFVGLPVLIWVAFRFGPREAASAVLLFSSVAVLGGSRSYGAYGNIPPNAALLLIQTFMGVSSVTALVLAAVVAEVRRDEEALRKAHDEMERRVEERTAALKASEERYRSLTQSANDAIITADRRGVVVSWNRGAQALFGYPEAEALGRPLTRLMPERYRERHQRGLEHLQATGEARVLGKTLDLHGLRKDGSEFPIELSLSSWKAEGEDFYTAIIRDVTERRKVEEDLQQKTQELARSNAELEVFASVASHDLQEPLRKIQMFGERLTETAASGLDAQGRDFINRMRGSAARMSRLIDDLLAYSRVTMDAGPIQEVSLDTVVREALADMEARIEATKAVVEVGPLPAVRADRAQMLRLFQNLLANALKFHRRDGPPRVTVAARALADGGIEVSVEDDGIGFDPKHRERIFKPFQRLHARGEYEGSGMGLAICEKIMLRHRGTITARSETGKGAAFVITFPQAGP